MILVKKSNGQSIIINDSSFTLNIGGGLLSLIKTSNIKDIIIDIKRVIYSGLIKALIRVIIFINNTFI